MIAVTSTVHALVLSLLMMSASMQASLWRELDSSLHRAQSVIMLFFYIAITMYYGGIPGIWKLSSACSRYVFVFALSRTAVFEPNVPLAVVEDILLDVRQMPALIYFPFPEKI